ncbi:transcriptional regulator Spx [Enterococcus casseliflavus]|nr:transcriptional regulator Spx [Enterococcus casseliflavus]
MDNILYTETSSKACAEVMDWLKENNIPFKERRITKARPLKSVEIIGLLSVSDNGFEDIVKRNKKIIKIEGKEVRLEDLSTSELIVAIINQPTILRTPILMNDKKMVVGFQITEMGIFVPKSVRRKELEKIIFDR